MDGSLLNFKNQMILIYSTFHDLSTKAVIEWLDHYKANWMRVNEFQFGKEISLHLQYDQTGTKNISVDEYNNSFNKVKAVWMRRMNSKGNINIANDSDLSAVFAFLNNTLIEQRSVWMAFNRTLSQKKWLNDIQTVSISKIKQLESAVKCGLKIPESIITTNKIQLKKFKQKHKHIISKTIESYPTISLKNVRYTPFTSQITDEFIEQLPDNFFPMLFQKNVFKEFEIRSFYLEGEFYSMAMFTQEDEATSTDFRVNGGGKNTRRVPFKLDKSTEKKLKAFMKIEGLNSGSFDLIVNKKGEFVFLEVNPLGQFGMVSYPCNYYLEKKIAQTLIQFSNERN